MLLEKVEVFNIRSHKHFILKPKKRGITAINGENGAGKSTLLDAFAWSLFGSRVNGQKNKDLIREGVDAEKEPVKVESIIIVGNQKYKIVRKIKDNAGLVSCKVYSKSIDDTDNSDWIFETGPSIKHAESYIRKILNTDEKGFLSSVFIQQKQVDNIISSTPKDRGQVIEKLIGVSAITEAIQMGREERRGLQTASTIIKPSSLEESKENLENQGKIVKKLKEEIDLLTIENNNFKEELLKIEDQYEKEQLLQKELELFNITLTTNNEKYKLLETQLTNQLTLIKETKLKKGRKVSVDLIQNEYNDLFKEINNKRNQLYKLEQRQEYLENLFKVEHNYNLLLSQQKLKEVNIETITKELEEVNTNIILLKEQIKSNKELIKLLKNGEGKCSLCGNLFDSPEKELEKHLNEADELKNSAINLKNKYIILNNELNENKESLKQINSFIDIAKEQEEERNSYLSLPSKIKLLSANIESDELELDIINKKLLSAKAEEQKQELLSTAKEQIKETENELSLIKDDIEILKKKIESSLAMSKTDYKELTRTLEDSKRKFEKDSMNLINLNHQLDLEKERGRTALSEYNNCKQAHEEYKKVTDQLTVVKLSNELLTKFKAERIKTSIPALTKIASEIFTKFTDGKFTELLLNEKFEAFVMTDTQVKRPIGLLSGGELSMAAIALRLAIALFLTNEEESLLILDEVLVSMSEDRSQAILETISNLTKSQVIFIAHNVSINQFADKVIQL